MERARVTRLIQRDQWNSRPGWLSRDRADRAGATSGIDISIPMDGGGVAVGDKMSISLEIEAVLQK